jgi:hypothetical protein
MPSQRFTSGFEDSGRSSKSLFRERAFWTGLEILRRFKCHLVAFAQPKVAAFSRPALAARKEFSWGEKHVLLAVNES